MLSEEERNLMQGLPQELEALYRTSVPNQDIELYSGDLILRLNGRDLPATGRIFLKWLPSPRARFEITHLKLHTLPDGELLVPALHLSYPASVLHVTPPEGPCSGMLSPRLTPPSLQASRLVFHVANFHSYFGDCIRTADCLGLWRGRLVFKHGPWRIDLDQVQRVEQVHEFLKADGGFALTHTGAIQLESCRQFDLADAIEILDALFYFLSFCRGIWCGPVLPVAFDSSKQAVWSQWVPGRIRQSQERRSWFTERHYDLRVDLPGAFSGFLSRWGSSLWKDPLRTAIHWYVEANSNAGGVEGGVVLAQTALELLSSVRLVEDPATRKHSAAQFDKKRADERIRLLLQELSIPIAVPVELAALTAAAPALQATDGVGAFVGLRNAIVHPKDSKRHKVISIGFPARAEALTLGLWYLELALLRLIDYHGDYTSRLKDGRYEDAREGVPWK